MPPDPSQPQTNTLPAVDVTTPPTKAPPQPAANPPAQAAPPPNVPKGLSRLTIRYGGTVGGVTDNTVKGILGNHLAQMVANMSGAHGEAPGAHVLVYDVPVDHYDALVEQLEEHSSTVAPIDVRKGEHQAGGLNATDPAKDAKPVKD